MQALLGIIVFCLIAWAVSENRRRIDWRVLLVGVILQFLLALVLLKVDQVRQAFTSLNIIVTSLDSATKAGTGFIFGYIGGGEAPFEVKNPARLFSLAFQALPLVLVMSALTSLLFYWKILPVIIKWISRLFSKTLGIGGAAALGSAANIFVGMVEAPLFIRPYISKLNRSELFIIMTTGMATIAGTMMVLYAWILTPVLGDAALGHLLVASIISAPAAIVMARLMVPQDKSMPVTAGELSDPHPAGNSMDAIAEGTMEGLKLWLNIIAMIIVLVALVELVNMMLGGLAAMIYDNPEPGTWTLQGILGWFFQYLAWLMGIPAAEMSKAGELLGIKVVLNEFLAYDAMAAYVSETNQALQAGTTLPAGHIILSERTRIILSYALCGFANLGSLGIMIGGLGGMSPERRSEIAGLGFKSILAGMLATMMTGAVVSFFY
ncbi:MAG: hypothetical protein KDK39_04660 [Leptospiraceae bacterium]|nr:hypothetical protein [Leptospiraceae bacterium]